MTYDERKTIELMGREEEGNLGEVGGEDDGGIGQDTVYTVSAYRELKTAPLVL